MQKFTLFNLPSAEKTENSFRDALRSAVRGFWNGNISRTQFEDDFRSSVNRRLNQAFDDIGKQYNITPNEYTTEEQLWIGRFIADQISHIASFANAIDDNKSDDGKLTPLLDRVDMWVNRWSEVQSAAKTFFAGNEKFVWEKSPLDSCSSCIRLNGVVKRGSFWKEARGRGIHPKSRNLACGGWRCGCSLRPTNAKVTMGPLPRI